MSTTQINQMWADIKWNLGVIAAIGFYLASYTFSTFSTKLDKVYEFSAIGAYRMERLEKEQNELQDELSRLQANRSEYKLEQGN